MTKIKGFTLIEVIVTIAIITLMSVSGAYLMIYVVQNSVFIPNKLSMDMIASEALDIMTEGDGSAGGLRFSASITDIRDNQVIFTNQDGRSIVYRLDISAEKLYRSIDGGPEALIPYYAGTGINIVGKDNKLLTYYRENVSETANPAEVRRIKIALIAKTGTGSYEDWEGYSEQSSSITVKPFQ